MWPISFCLSVGLSLGWKRCTVLSGHWSSSSVGFCLVTTGLDPLLMWLMSFCGSFSRVEEAYGVVWSLVFFLFCGGLVWSLLVLIHFLCDLFSSVWSLLVFLWVFLWSVGLSLLLYLSSSSSCPSPLVVWPMFFLTVTSSCYVTFEARYDELCGRGVLCSSSIFFFYVFPLLPQCQMFPWCTYWCCLILDVVLLLILFFFLCSSSSSVSRPPPKYTSWRKMFPWCADVA